METKTIIDSNRYFSVLKFHFEQYLEYEISDELFNDILNTLPKCVPAGPGGYKAMGLRAPLWRLMEGRNETCSVEGILSFFRYQLKNNKRRYWSLVLHVPHSSTAFPDDCEYDFSDLDYEERLLIDYYTDELFIPKESDSRIDTILFPFCRLYCDVERIIDDPLEETGFGISYQREIPMGRGGIRYRYFSTAYHVWDKYLEHHLKAAMKILRPVSPLVIDCHSFSARPNLLDKEPPKDIDICIGFNEDITKPDKVVIGNICKHFSDCGYIIGINKPFSNSKTFPLPANSYHSVMIEVNKRLYMDEISLKKTSGFEKLQHDIQSLCVKLFKPRND